MSKVGDIVFCLVTSSKEPSYWVVKEVSSVNPVGEITEVQSIDAPESRCSISLFLDRKSPIYQGDFTHNLAKAFQLEYAGRMSVMQIDRLIDVIDSDL